MHPGPFLPLSTAVTDSCYFFVTLCTVCAVCTLPASKARLYTGCTRNLIAYQFLGRTSRDAAKVSRLSYVCVYTFVLSGSLCPMKARRTFHGVPAAALQVAQVCLLCRARHKRHTYASWMVQKGVSIYHVSKLLGHSTVTTTQRHYASLETSDLHDVVNRVFSRIVNSADAACNSGGDGRKLSLTIPK
jgi:hypothetical protein